VIAFAKGGATETLCSTGSPGPTVVYFAQQSVDAIMDAVRAFEQKKISAMDCRNNALRFSQERFRLNFSSFVDVKFKEFKASSVG